MTSFLARDIVRANQPWWEGLGKLEPTAEDRGSVDDSALVGPGTPPPGPGAVPDRAPPTPATTGPPPVPMPPHIFYIATGYLVVLIGLFVAYFTVPWLHSRVPLELGPIPAGVVWFGATGAVMASLYGIFVHNQHWDPSYTYWHYCRPLFGAVTGSISALIYLVLLTLGDKTTPKMNNLTFFVVAFVLGFADGAFMQLLHKVTSVIIKPGGGGTTAKAPPDKNGSTAS